MNSNPRTTSFYFHGSEKCPLDFIHHTKPGLGSNLCLSVPCSSGEIRMALVLYKNLGQYLSTENASVRLGSEAAYPNYSLIVNSPVITAAINKDSNKIYLSEPVRFVVSHLQVSRIHNTHIRCFICDQGHRGQLTSFTPRSQSRTSTRTARSGATPNAPWRVTGLRRTAGWGTRTEHTPPAPAHISPTLPCSWLTWRSRWASTHIWYLCEDPPL